MRVFGICGWKNSGKTGLVVRLVAHFTARGLRVTTVKHAHHAARLDTPGSDTDRHAGAGAREVMLVTDAGLSLVRPGPPPPMDELLNRLEPADLVLLEGFKSDDHPKIACHRAGASAPPDPDWPGLRAIASDTPVDTALPRLDLDDTDGIAAFIAAELGL